MKRSNRPVIDFKPYETERLLTLALRVEIGGHETIALVNNEAKNKIISGLYNEINEYIGKYLR